VTGGRASIGLAPIGAALFAAIDNVRAAEGLLEDLLDAIYGDDWATWDLDEHRRELDVYLAAGAAGLHEEAEAELGRLRRRTLEQVGFARVTEHAHAYEHFTRCTCRLDADHAEIVS
jgi:hypothetical protein